MVEVSNHAADRLKERCGLKKKSIQRMAEKVYICGIRHSETKGNLNKWISGLYSYNKNANNIRLYGDKAYIFAGQVLITVIQIPSDLFSNMKNLVKTN